jgi:hypothetical protein
LACNAGAVHIRQLDIEIADAQGVIFNEIAARLDQLAHEC